MDTELQQRLDAIDAQLAEIRKDTRQTKRFIAWQLAIQVLMIILPFVLLAILIPVMTSILGSLTGGVTGDINTEELMRNIEELQQMAR